MDSAALPDTDQRVGLPWFRGRPRWAAAAAAFMFLAVFSLRLTTGGVEDAINLLYTLPIALLALAFGRVAGIAAGLLAVVLVGAWVVIDGIDLSLMGWASRLVPLLLLGGLLGDAADRLADADARHRAMEAAAQRQRDATEVNDTLIQGMAAARWSIEAGRYDAGLSTLTETLEVGHRLVSKLMRDADMGLDGHRPPGRG